MQTCQANLARSVGEYGMPVLDLRSHGHKCLLNIGRVFGTRFQERDANLVCECLRAYHGIKSWLHISSVPQPACTCSNIAILPWQHQAGCCCSRKDGNVQQ